MNFRVQYIDDKGVERVVDPDLFEVISKFGWVGEVIAIKTTPSLKELIRSINMRLRFWEELKVPPIQPKGAGEDIVALLRRTGGPLNTATIARYFKIPRSTAYDRLCKLRDGGKVDKKGIGETFWWFIPR